MTAEAATAAPVADYLDGLNPDQLYAVLHGGGAVADPLLVIARAGSGKTGTLATGWHTCSSRRRSLAGYS